MKQFILEPSNKHQTQTQMKYRPAIIGFAQQKIAGQKSVKL